MSRCRPSVVAFEDADGDEVPEELAQGAGVGAGRSASAATVTTPPAMWSATRSVAATRTAIGVTRSAMAQTASAGRSFALAHGWSSIKPPFVGRNPQAS